jgi:DnaJ like chaperone protein
MSWVVIIIGTTIGLVVGGPIGAIIGAGIAVKISSENEDTKLLSSGSISNCTKISSETENINNIKNSDDDQVIFFTSLNSMLAKIAKADGVICKKEIERIQSFFKEMELDSEDKKTAINIFNKAKSDDTSIYDYAQQYYEVANQEMCEMIYSMLWDVAIANGEPHKNQDLILRKITHYLGLPNTLYEKIKESLKDQDGEVANLEESYKILECKKDDTNQVIKQKYRKAMAEYHPDKIQSKNLPQGFIDYANEQSKKINNAYANIMKDRKHTE